MIPDNVEKIIMTKEDYDRNVEQLLVDKCKAELEVERLNNIINELEKYLTNYIEYTKLKWGNQLTDNGYLDIQMAIKNYGDILDKIKELKGE